MKRKVRGALKSCRRNLSEVADVGVGTGSDEESFASKDMASSADMDGEDIGLRGDAEARILLWCAREIGDTVRMSVDTSFRAMELRVSAIEERLAGFDGMVAKLKKSRGVHRSAILELETKTQVLEKRSLAMVRSLTQTAGHSAALEAHVATVKVVQREGPWLCCSLADDCVSGALRSSAHKFWSEGHLNLCCRAGRVWEG